MTGQVVVQLVLGRKRIRTYRAPVHLQLITVGRHVAPYVNVGREAFCAMMTLVVAFVV
jgi:hypothetical protein